MRTTISCAASRVDAASGRRATWLALATAVLSASGALAPARAASPQAQPAVFPLAERWLASLDGEASAPPVVEGGRVFVPIGGRQIAALALTDGATLWSVDLEITSRLAVGDDLVFAATPEGIIAVWTTTGDVRWGAPLGIVTTPLRFQAGWLVVATASGELLALRAADGTVIWRQDLGAAAAAAATIEGDRLYVPLSDGRVVARRLDTGEPLWEARLGGAGREMVALPDRIYVGSVDNRVYCLAARDGRQLWRWRTGADVIGGAAVDDERLYVVSLDNILYALDRRTGVRRWRAPLPTRAVGPPSLAGPAVFVPVSSADLTFAPRARGRPLAHVALPAELLQASAFDAARDPAVVVVTVDAAGRAQLAAFGAGRLPPLEPLAFVPGEDLGWPVPLVRTELPFRSLALPGPRRPGGRRPRRSAPAAASRTRAE